MKKQQLAQIRLATNNANAIERCISGKPIYDKKGAQTAKNRRMKTGHVKLRIYECSLCTGWHLTSRV